MIVSYRPFAVHMMHICTMIWWRWWSEYSVLILAYLTTLLVYWRSVDLITLHPHNRRSSGYFSCLSVEQTKYSKGYRNSGKSDKDINNSMEQSPSSWTNSSREIQDIRCILWDQAVQCFVHTGKPKFCVLNQINPVSALLPCFGKQTM